MLLVVIFYGLSETHWLVVLHGISSKPFLLWMFLILFGLGLVDRRIFWDLYFYVSALIFIGGVSNRFQF